MSDRFLRQIRVDVANLVIRNPLHIQCQIDLPDPSAKIWIANLNRPTHSIIQNALPDSGAITVAAGYAQTLGILMEGYAHEVRRYPQGGNYLTEIFATGQLQAPTANGLMGRTYEQPTRFRQIASDLIADMGLKPGPMTHIPESATMEEFSWLGAPSSGLSQLLTYLDEPITWYESDGFINFRRAARPQPDADTITLSPTTGLIGAPSRRDNERITAEAMLDARLRVGNIVSLDTPDLFGAYTITSLTHHADNRDGHFKTKLELSSEDPIPDPPAFRPVDQEYGNRGPFGPF